MPCQKCHGTGFLAFKDDPSPAGVSLSSGYMIETEACPDCYGKNVCPVCGQKMVEVTDWATYDCEKDKCVCGWTYQNGQEKALEILEKGE